jgi:enamine deaminase RidA (YjgF/YER057c/UK114 family)
VTDKLAISTDAFGRKGVSGAYAQAIAVPPGRPLLFTAGIIARDPAGELVGPGDVEAQARRVFENLEHLVDAAHATMADVVKITIYLRDIEGDLPIVQRVRSEHWPQDAPAATAVEVAKLMTDDVRVEVEAIVLLPASLPAPGQPAGGGEG